MTRHTKSLLKTMRPEKEKFNPQECRIRNSLKRRDLIFNMNDKLIIAMKGCPQTNKPN